MYQLNLDQINHVTGGIVMLDQDGFIVASGRDNFACEVGATSKGDNSSYGSSPSGVANPNACASAITSATGIGATIGALIGLAGGALGTALGAVVGGAAAGGYAAANNPACDPVYGR